MNIWYRPPPPINVAARSLTRMVVGYRLRRNGVSLQRVIIVTIDLLWCNFLFSVTGGKELVVKLMLPWKQNVHIEYTAAAVSVMWCFTTKLCFFPVNKPWLKEWHQEVKPGSHMSPMVGDLLYSLHRDKTFYTPKTTDNYIADIWEPGFMGTWWRI